MAENAKEIAKTSEKEIFLRVSEHDCSLYEAVVRHVFYSGFADKLNFICGYIFCEEVLRNILKNNSSS